jgi:hypothetical protein
MMMLALPSGQPCQSWVVAAASPWHHCPIQQQQQQATRLLLLWSRQLLV